MDDHVIDIFLKRKDLNGMKEFISRDGNVLKYLSSSKKTALEYMLRNDGKAFNDMRDEAILYLIEEEAKARCTKNLWSLRKWNECIQLALDYSNSEKVLLKLIHTGSTYIPNFRVKKNLIYRAIKDNFSAENITTLLKSYTEGEINKCNKLLFNAITYDWDINIIKLLVDVGANLLSVDYCNKNLFFYIPCVFCDRNNCKSKPTIDFLVKNGVDLRHCDRESNTILHIAKCPYLMYLAIRNGVSVNHKNKKGDTPLVEAIKSGDDHKVLMIVQSGTNPDSLLKSNWFYSKNFLLLRYNRKTVDILLYHGVDFLATFREKKIVLDKALIKDVLPINNVVRIFKCSLHKILMHYTFFMDQNDLFNCFPGLSDSSLILSFIEECKVEQGRMKCIFLTDTLTLHKFCHLKKYYKSEFVNILCTKFKFNEEQIADLFPIYCDFINIRIEDNVRKRWNKVMCDILENIVILPINNLDCMSISSECYSLNYDCLYYVSKYLKKKDLYKLFLASNSVSEVCLN